MDCGWTNYSQPGFYWKKSSRISVNFDFEKTPDVGIGRLKAAPRRAPNAGRRQISTPAAQSDPRRDAACRPGSLAEFCWRNYRTVVAPAGSKQCQPAAGVLMTLEI